MARVGEGFNSPARADSPRVVTSVPSIRPPTFWTFPVYTSSVSAPNRVHRGRRALWIASALNLLALAAYIRIGSHVDIPFAEIARQILAGPEGQGAQHTIVWQIRLPRGIAVMLVGAMLGAVGSAFQALLRNPLAEPYIVGVSSGAAVGGALALVFGVAGFAGGLSGMGAGFIGGLGALALVFALARRHGQVDVTTLLLAGVAVGALLSALLSFILLYAGQDTNRVLGFLLGHTSDMTWAKVAALAPILLIGLSLLMATSRALNAFAMGEGTAQRLGVDVPRLSRTILVTGTAMTAATVGAVGIVGFVGLVAPHIARRTVGVDWRVSLPMAALVGMLVMLLADLIAQRGLSLLTGNPGMEVNVGIVAAILGAPSLLILLRKQG